MNFEHPKNQVLITGMSFSGKSTLWLKMMRERRAKYKIVFDADNEVHIKFGWPRAVTEQQMEFYMGNRQPFCFDPSHLYPGDRRGGFDFFSRWVMNVCSVVRGVKIVCVDEMSKVQRPGIGGVPIKFMEMADSGRKQEIDLLLVSHSPRQVHKDIRMHMSEIITFRHNEPDELQALKENGFDPEQVKVLAYPGGYLRRNLITGQLTSYAPDASRKASSRKTVKG